MSIEKIPTSQWGDPADDVVELGYSSKTEIESLLLGRSVVEVDDDHLRLDDGTVIKVVPNQGGCGCTAGDYDLESLNRVDNIITKVEFDYKPAGDDFSTVDDPDNGFYRIFVFAGDERVNLLSVTGSDGNGYYGTGFDLYVQSVAP